MLSGVILALFYLVTPFAEFLSTGDPTRIYEPYYFLGPQGIRFSRPDGSFRLSVKTLPARDPSIVYRQPAPESTIYLGFFAKGFMYRLLGFIETDRHLIGFEDPDMYDERPALFTLGSDDVGRDIWSRLLMANRVSLSIGLLAAAIALIVGVVMGGVAGYFGSRVDTVMRRVIDIKRVLPSLPLWMILAATIPPGWSAYRAYLAIAALLSIFAWTETAQIVSSKFLAQRNEDYVTAARTAGASERRIIFRHILPSLYGRLLTQFVLIIPSMMIGEASLSFLGLGLRPPTVSYGVMLIQVQDPTWVALYPWLMFAAIPFIIVVLSFNLFSDGLRSAARHVM